MKFTPRPATAVAADGPSRNWSSLQQAIFNEFRTGTRHIKVVARAGSGKSTSIVEGVNQAPEDNIWVAAFNKPIQLDMEKKLRNPRAVAKTIHAVGMSCIKRKWGDKAQGPDNDRAFNIAKEVLADLSLARSIPLPPEVLAKSLPGTNENPLVKIWGGIVQAVANWATKVKEINPLLVHEEPKAETYEAIEFLVSSFDLLPEDALESEGWSSRRIAAYTLRALKKAAAFSDMRFDFADMVFLPLVNGWCYPRFDMIVVDEMQDLNAPMFTFVQKMLRSGGRVVMVGDPKQAIYRFRGADTEGMDRLGAMLDAVELPLTITYRCPLAVVREAQRLVPDIEARPGAPEGVVRDINLSDLARETRPGDAVLSRVNAMLMKCALGSMKLNKPVMIVGKDIGDALLKLTKKITAENLSLEAFNEELEDFRTEQRQKLAATKDRSNKNKLERLLDQADALRAISDGLADSGLGRDTFGIHAKIRELFTEKDRAKVVVFSSIHGMKGGEAERVFVLQDTLYCYGKKNGDQEEKNLEYVAITRAKSELIWVHDSSLKSMNKLEEAGL